MAKILPFNPIARQPAHKILAGDLTLMLHNGTLTRWDIKTILEQLEAGDEFGYILPKVLQVNIPVPYQSELLPYQAMALDASSQQARAVYLQYDSIMVKNEPIQ